MPSHDEFLELGAVAAIGEITEEEERELAAHLRGCADCREAYAEYSAILRQDLPRANSTQRHSDRPESRIPDCELRERFLAHARALGFEFSPDVDRPAAFARGGHLQVQKAGFGWLALAAALVVVACGALMANRYSGRKTATPSSDASTLAPAASSDLKQLKVVPARVRSTGDPLIAILEKRNADFSSQVKDRDSQLAQSQRQLELLTSQLEQLRNDRSDLLASRDRDQLQIADLKNQIQGENANSVAATVELQDRIRALNAALQEQTQKLQMERQMTTVSSDVRQLMGARNLHIVDVHDVNGVGKSDRAFGRVFYSEGQSLVFYAFDLPNGKPTPAKYYFKAWGQQEATANSIHNLGTFTVDDRERHRWVLKITDSSLLKGIDSVFVTAETVGDHKQPEGKRLLYAYLAGSANHP